MNGRNLFGVAGGLAVIGLLILLPAPATVRQHATSGTPAALVLSTVWPKATVFTLPATFPDGSTYLPQAVLDSTTSIGLANSADGQRFSLVVAGSSAQPRILDSALISDGVSFDAVTVTSSALYWMKTATDLDGLAHTVLWTANRSGGPARRVGNEAGQPVYVGAPVFSGSAYDMQVVDGRLYWLSGSDDPAVMQLRSIPLAGGHVEVRSIPGKWTMASWPWLVTAPGSPGAPIELYNLNTSSRVPVQAPPNTLATCNPTWCRFMADNVNENTGTELAHPDGTALQHIGDKNAVPIANDVALQQRFEPLVTAVSDTGTSTVSRLDLYDIAHHETVLIEPATTNAVAKGDFLWWATGDNETLAWHALDLRTLT